jgi:hypothetical protein
VISKSNAVKDQDPSATRCISFTNQETFSIPPSHQFPPFRPYHTVVNSSGLHIRSLTHHKMSNPTPIPPPPNSVPLSVPASTPSDSVWNRISNWASENKAVVYTIAGVTLVVTGAGVYYYLSSNDSSKPSQSSSSKKKSKNKKKFKKDDDTASKAESSKSEAPSASVTSGDLPVDIDELTDEYIASLSEHVRWSFNSDAPSILTLYIGEKRHRLEIKSSWQQTIWLKGV